MTMTAIVFSAHCYVGSHGAERDLHAIALLADGTEFALCGAMRTVDWTPVALVVMAACSSSVSFEEYRSELRRLRCEAAFRCVENGETPMVVWPNEAEWGASIEECAGIPDPYLDHYADSIAAGRVRYDPSAAADCLDDAEGTYERVSCKYLWDRFVNDDLCARMFEGTVPVGGVCFIAADCDEGGRCSVPGTDQPGACWAQ